MNHVILKKLLFFAVLFLLATLFSMEARAEKRIGVLLFSEEKRYHETVKGIMDELEKNGFAEPAVNYTITNAEGSKARAAKLAQEFAAAKMDLIIALGTSAAIAVEREIKDVPVVFSMVHDPVEANIAEDWQSSGNNTTGTSPNYPMSQLVSNLKQLTPLKKLAVLYTRHEQNSESQLKAIQKIALNFQIEVIPVPLNSKEDVAQIIPAVTRTVDAMYLSGSIVVASTAAMIAAIATKAKVVTVSRTEDLVEKGVLLGVYADPLQIGRLAGQKAVMILKGTKPSSIPIEKTKKVNLIINMKTARDGGFQIPPAFMKKVTKTIE